jgi:hypothetical protein
MCGRISNELRLPMTPLAESNRPALAHLLTEAGLQLNSE